MTHGSTIQQVAHPRELLPLLYNQESANAESCLHSCQVQNHFASVTILHQEKIHVSCFTFSLVHSVLQQSFIQVRQIARSVLIYLYCRSGRSQKTECISILNFTLGHTLNINIKNILSTSLGLSFHPFCLWSLHLGPAG